MYLDEHNIAPERLLEQTEDSVLVEFSVTDKCDFFDGHFPEIALLPAVAQIDIMLFFARKYLKTPKALVSSKRTKFGAPIFPGTTVHLNMKFNKEKNAVTYKMISVDGEKTYSTGTFVVGEKN